MRERRTKGKVASSVTLIMRRDSPKWGNHPKPNRRKMVRASYIRVKRDSRKLPEGTWNKIQELYHGGWKINWIAKELGIDWHTVK